MIIPLSNTFSLLTYIRVISEYIRVLDIFYPIISIFLIIHLEIKKVDTLNYFYISSLTLFPFLPFHSRKPTHFPRLKSQKLPPGFTDIACGATVHRDILFILDFSLSNIDI